MEGDGRGGEGRGGEGRGWKGRERRGWKGMEGMCGEGRGWKGCNEKGGEIVNNVRLCKNVIWTISSASFITVVFAGCEAKPA